MHIAHLVDFGLLTKEEKASTVNRQPPNVEHQLIKEGESVSDDDAADPRSLEKDCEVRG